MAALLIAGVVGRLTADETPVDQDVATSATPDGVDPRTVNPDGVDPRTADYLVGRHSLTVDGVGFSFKVPARGWQPYGSLLIGKSTHGPQRAEAIVLWTSHPGTDVWPCPHVQLESIYAYLSWADRYATSMAIVPGIEVMSGPSDVTVGGRAAKHVEVVVREDAGCDPGFFYSWKPQTGGALWTRSELGDTINMWMFELDGTPFVIASETRADARPPVQQEIEEIIASIRFD